MVATLVTMPQCYSKGPALIQHTTVLQMQARRPAILRWPPLPANELKIDAPIALIALKFVFAQPIH